MSARRFTGNWFSVIVILQFLLAAVKAQASIEVREPQHENVVLGTEDYLKQHLRQYNDSIAKLEQELVDFGNIYVAKFVPLELQISLLEEKIKEAENKLAPLEFLAPLTRHCVSKYRAQLPEKSAVKAKINACVSANKNSLTSILSSPTSRVSILKTYYHSTMKTYVNKCKSQHVNSTYNYTMCVSDVIATADSYTITQMDLYTSYLYSSECAANKYVHTATQCSFNIIYSSIGSIHETLLSVDKCIEINANANANANANNNSQCSGGANNSTSVACDNVINLPLLKQDFLNATIQNPFYGLANIKCLQVNFV